MLQYQTLSQSLIKLIRELQAEHLFRNYRLVGGTALALQLGHRKSVDIDLFTDKTIERDEIRNYLHEKYPNENIPQNIKNTGFGLVTMIHKIKVDFCNDGGKFMDPEINMDDIRMATLSDMAAMKVGSMTDRVTKKDYYDMSFLLDKFSMNDILNYYQRRYPYSDKRIGYEAFKKHHLADNTPDPDMIIKISWQDVKSKINKAALNFIDLIRETKEKKHKEHIRKIEELIMKKKKTQ